MISEAQFQKELELIISNAIREDVGDGDHSSLACIPASAQGKAKLLVKDEGIIAGVEFAKMIFHYVDKDMKVETFINDGERVKYGDVVFHVSGSSQSILKAERLVLNSMQRMSAIATKTKMFVDLLEGTKTKILDTRKTTPGIRAIEKWAVKIGGGENHRFALLDKNGNILKRFGNYPKDYKPNNTDIENGAIYQCLLTSQNEKKVFAAACGIGESIMFYDLNNKNNPHLIREFTFDHPQYDLTGDNEQPVIFSKDSKNGFIDIKSSSNYCICLFSGEVRTGVNDYGGNKILIFDWKGNPIKLIVLEETRKPNI